MGQSAVAVCQAVDSPRSTVFPTSDAVPSGVVGVPAAWVEYSTSREAYNEVRLPNLLESSRDPRSAAWVAHKEKRQHTLSPVQIERSKIQLDAQREELRHLQQFAEAEYQDHEANFAYQLEQQRRKADKSRDANEKWRKSSGEASAELQSFLRKEEGPQAARRVSDVEPIEDSQIAAPQFEINITKVAGERLGMDVMVSDGDTLEIIKIEDGLFSRWNASNPSQQIQAGDYIIDVNDARGDPQNMVDAMRKASTLKVTLIRVEPCSVEMGLFFAQHDFQLI